jgi:hypothetical protein
VKSYNFKYGHQARLTKKHDCQNNIKVLIQAVCILETTGPASIVTLGNVIKQLQSFVSVNMSFYGS